MKRLKSILFFALALPLFVFSQDEPINFSVSVSTDSILFGNYFEVKFTLENANGNDFLAPDFSESFNLVSGPNTSSSFSMMNGKMSQSISYTYYLEPKETGVFYILPASVNADGEMVETQPLEVLVVPNPDGLEQPLPSEQRRNPFEQFDWSNPFLDFNFEFPEMTPPSELLPDSIPAPIPQKKKLKTTRI